MPKAAHQSTASGEDGTGKCASLSGLLWALARYSRFFGRSLPCRGVTAQSQAASGLLEENCRVGGRGWPQTHLCPCSCFDNAALAFLDHPHGPAMSVSEAEAAAIGRADLPLRLRCCMHLRARFTDRTKGTRWTNPWLSLVDTSHLPVNRVSLHQSTIVVSCWDVLLVSQAACRGQHHGFDLKTCAPSLRTQRGIRTCRPTWCCSQRLVVESTDRQWESTHTHGVAWHRFDRCTAPCGDLHLSRK